MSVADGCDLDAHLECFGLTSFREGQRDVIATVLAGVDCLCIMPTGGGKSLCYQLPAVARDGVVLVISPLIALMKDQVDALLELEIRVTFINSTLSSTEQYIRLQAMASGQYDLVYVAPERFRSPRFIEAVKETQIQLLAVDEAHCISEWGHDFRPDYARLGWFRQRIGNPTTIALTATATPLVQEDVVKQLQLNQPRTFIAGFARPNLRFEVVKAAGARDKNQLLLDFLADTPGNGIIYVSARKRCEEVAEIMGQDGRRVGIYHAGLLSEDRRKVHEDFMGDRVQIIVATVAFGMGIDKADVRFVVHFNMPGTMEAYYQEAGRAGRDSRPARCMLIYSPGDRYIQEFFIENAYPSRETIERVYNYLRELDDDPIELTHQELKDSLDLPVGTEGVGACVQILEKCGVLERVEPHQNMAMVRLESDLPTLVDLLPQKANVQRKVLQAVQRLVGQRRYEMVYFQPRSLSQSAELEPAALARALRELRKLDAFDYVPPFRGRAIHMHERQRTLEQLDIDFEALDRRKAAEYEKLELVVRYAKSTWCRQAEILQYFGDCDAKPCGNCDNCRPTGGETTDPAAENSIREDQHLVKAAKMVLSGVARARGRFGKQMVAQMLWGSKSAKMTKWNLDQLSTFGLLGHLAQSDVVALIDALIGVDLIEQVDIDRYRPVVQLTPLGEEVMRGNEGLPNRIALPGSLFEKIRQGTGPAPQPQAAVGRAPTASLHEADLPPPNPELLEKLRQWRRQLAEETGWRAYKRFSNTTLDSLARMRPTSLRKLEEIYGIGPAKRDRYGEQILNVIRPFTCEVPSQLDESSSGYSSSDSTTGALSSNLGTLDLPRENAAQASATASNKSVTIHQAANTDQPPHYWTWRLLSAGFALRECAEIRGLEPGTVLDHALRAVDSGLPLEPHRLLSSVQIEALEAIVGSHPNQSISTLPSKLPAGVSRRHAELFLKCRAAD